MSIDTLFKIIDRDKKGVEAPAVDGNGHKPIFVGAKPAEMPTNQLLKYATIQVVLDLYSVDPGTVVLFDQSAEGLELLQLVCQNMERIGVDCTYMQDVPATTDTAALREAVFGIPNVVYSIFLSELMMDVELANQRELSVPKRKIDQEMNQYTRKNGTVKEADIEVFDADDSSNGND